MYARRRTLLLCSEFAPHCSRLTQQQWKKSRICMTKENANETKEWSEKMVHRTHRCRWSLSRALFKVTYFGCSFLRVRNTLKCKETFISIWFLPMRRKQRDKENNEKNIENSINNWCSWQLINDLPFFSFFFPSLCSFIHFSMPRLHQSQLDKLHNWLKINRMNQWKGRKICHHFCNSIKFNWLIIASIVVATK